MKTLSILDLLDLNLTDKNELHLTCIAGKKGLSRELDNGKINRPGLTMSGFMEEFSFNCIQLFGKGEELYLEKLEKENKLEYVEKMFEYSIPTCVFSNSYTPGERFLEIATAAGCPVLQTPLSSTQFEKRVIQALENFFAPSKTIHGVLMEVFGVGVLITGDSGVGKSETALALIERGHRLISDDAVRLSSVEGKILKGSGEKPDLAHHMEIRGIGIINVKHLFGISAIRDTKQVQLWVEMEEWDNNKNYDRVGEDATREILGIEIPIVKLPVKPGRNIPIIIETAAMNERLKKLGYHSARDFNNSVLKWLESKSARELYYSDDDSF